MNKFMKIVMTLVVAAICFVLFGYAVGPDKEIRATVDSVPNILRANLKDPDSLEIDSLTLYRAYDGVLHACGSLRAKNGFGGYTKALFVIAPRYTTPVVITENVANGALDACAGQIVYTKS